MILNPTTKPPEVKVNTGHIHEYVRSSKNKDIYRCVHPDCSHYHNREYLENKRALCGKCKESFILTKAQLKNKVPACLSCSKSNKAKKVKRIEQVLDQILNSSQKYDEKLRWDKNV